jgi:deoxyribose-phosphate aldolase
MIDPVLLLDLTTLNDDDTDEVVRALCAKAISRRGPVAAVCVLPPFVTTALEALAAANDPAPSPVRVATVANFPAGADDPAAAAREVAASVAAGAHEVDVVVPWRAHLAGDRDAVARLVAACAAPDVLGDATLKAILETGSHGDDAAATREMADAALRAGATFVKTSTGKHGPGASPQAAAILLDAVVAHGSGGVKVSGGVRTVADAEAYVAQAGTALGDDQVTPATFRIGASSLLDELLKTPR